jgi:hypothetical protein
MVGVRLKILVNGFGISDSGGVKVLEKLLRECVEAREDNQFVIMLTHSHLIEALVDKYQIYDMFSFKVCKFNNYIHRLYYENSTFRVLIAQYGIDLVYNFTASTQFFLDCPQLVKMHNLLWYSKKLDHCYKRDSHFILWIRQIVLKRVVFKFMLNKSKYIEIQSKHVEECISDYINIKNKHIFVKSDVDVTDNAFRAPRKYDFSKKLKFLYIVGPHFNYTHKNFLDFTNSMVELAKLNVDFEISITLQKHQLAGSKLWNELLNSRTDFHGYIDDPKKLEALFCDNTILISTSVIETLGLHVLEGIRNGVVTITPNEDYAEVVYGKKRYSYELFDVNSLCKTIAGVVRDVDIIADTIRAQQRYLRENEMSKFKNIVAVFREVLDV